MLYFKNMKKKGFLISLAIGLLLAIVWVLFLRPQNKPLSSPYSAQVTTKQLKPSETLKEYSDPSGFSFSYPDNLSLTKNQTDDETIYADLQLSVDGVNGSLNLKIADSKFKSIDEWLALNQGESEQVKLGNLAAFEVKTNDRLLLGALDQGVLFTIEMPRIDEDFWMPVYKIVLESFSFTLPQVESSSDEVIFEGEEVVF